MKIGETITMGGEYGFEITRTISEDDGLPIYLVTEAGDFHAEYEKLGQAVRDVQGKINGYLAQAYRDLLADDDDAAFQLSCKLESSTKPEAESKLRALIAGAEKFRKNPSPAIDF